MKILPTSQENGLSKDSGADCFQVEFVSIQRFASKLGAITEEQMQNVACAIALCVGYKKE
jgi:mRNA interferase MazF